MKFVAVKIIKLTDMNVPCILDCQSLVVPILHPFHHPSRPVSWHRDLECAQACPSLQVSCHLDHQCSHGHPNHLVSLPQDPESINLHRLLNNAHENSLRQVFC